MTLTASERTTIKRIIVRDDTGPLSFMGEEMVDLSWSYAEAESRGYTRWTDITLYRVCEPESAYAYVVQVMGRSVVYHKAGSPCRRGMKVSVEFLREDTSRYNALVACDRRGCVPVDLDDLNDQDFVSVEEPIPTLHKCTSASDLVKQMENRSGAGLMNGLSMKILQRASLLDPDVAMAMAQTRGL